MAALQRSATTFRRSGSSGLVWDERFFSGELAKPKNREVGLAAELSEPLRHDQGVGLGRGGIACIRTTATNGSGGRGPSAAAAAEPPSPKVPICICCGFSTGKHADKRAKRRGHR